MRHFLLAIAAVLALASLAGAPRANAATQQFTAVADAYTDSVNPSVNFGGYSTVKIDGNVLRVGYVRFNPQELPGPVTNATLRVYTRTSNATGFSVRPVASTTWDERTLNHNNRPVVPSTVLSTTGAFSSGVYRSLDVTAAVKGNGPISFAITTPTSQDILLASRETGSTTAPQLIVETADAAPAPAPAPAPEPPPNPAPTPAEPCTLYASPTGSSSGAGTLASPVDIRTAENRAVPGSVVCALPGVYALSSALMINNHGEEGRPITFRAEGGEAVLQYTGTSDQNHVVQFSGTSPVAHHVVVEGFVIDGRGANGVLASQGVKLNKGGSNVLGAHHITIRNNTLRYFGSAGVGTKHNDYVTVTGNLIYHTGYDPDTGWSSGVSLNSHVWSDNAPGFHSYIVGNVISGSSDESSYNTDGSGVIIDLGGNAPPVLVANNVAFENGDHCVQALDVANIWIVNNTCYKNGLDNRQSGTGEITLNRAGAVNVHVINNVADAWTGRRPFQQFNGATGMYRGNVEYGGNTSSVPSTVLGDPQQLRRSSALFVAPPFVDPSAPLQQATALPPWELGGRLVPQTGGALIDTAINPLTAPGVTPELRAGMERHLTRDVAGQTRPRGAGWDVGAYEAG
jgi:hypothetical protein